MGSSSSLQFSFFSLNAGGDDDDDRREKEYRGREKIRKEHLRNFLCSSSAVYVSSFCPVVIIIMELCISQHERKRRRYEEKKTGHDKDDDAICR